MHRGSLRAYIRAGSRLGINGNLRWGTVREGFSVFSKKNNNANLEWGVLELLIIELMGLKTNKDFL
jgi:hypothetical protein